MPKYDKQTDEMLLGKANQMQQILRDLPIGQGVDIITCILYALVDQMEFDDKQTACGHINLNLMRLLVGDEAMDELEKEIGQVMEEIVLSETPTPATRH